MEEEIKQRLTRRSIWMRALYMLALAIGYGIAELVWGIVVLLQFVVVLLTGTANENLLRLGNNLSAYVRQVLRYLTFNSEALAFPFGDWPDEAVAKDNVWIQSIEPKMQDASSAAGQEEGPDPAVSSTEVSDAPSREDTASHPGTSPDHTGAPKP